MFHNRDTYQEDDRESARRKYVLPCYFLVFAMQSVYSTGVSENDESETEPMVMTLLAAANSWAAEYLGERFNVQIVGNGMSVNDYEKVDIMLAAGEFPDCGPFWELALPLYEEGVVREIPNAMIRDYAPDVADIYDSYPKAWLANTNPNNNAELLAVNRIAANMATNIFLPMMRVDWIYAVGFELPEYESTKMPLDEIGRVFFLDRDLTLDWYQSLLRAFRDGDPDGDGRQNTVPYGEHNTISHGIRVLAGHMDSCGNFGGTSKVD
jgi:hypothetical protein